MKSLAVDNARTYRARWSVLIGLLLAVALAACQPIAAPMSESMPESMSESAPESVPVEEPIVAEVGYEIRYVEAGTAGEPLALDGDAGAVVNDLTALLADIEARARTFFDPARFDAEVAPEPHVLITYAEETELQGEGIMWSAKELVVVVVDQEPMLLARTADSSDWSVFLPADADLIPDFIAAVRSQAR